MCINFEHTNVGLIYRFDVTVIQFHEFNPIYLRCVEIDIDN